MSKYIVVKTEDILGLSNIVNENIGAGYELIGGVSVQKSGGNYPKEYFYQAMLLTEATGVDKSLTGSDEHEAPAKASPKAAPIHPELDATNSLQSTIHADTTTQAVTKAENVSKFTAVGTNTEAASELAEILSQLVWEFQLISNGLELDQHTAEEAGELERAELAAAGKAIQAYHSQALQRIVSKLEERISHSGYDSGLTHEEIKKEGYVKAMKEVKAILEEEMNHD